MPNLPPHLHFGDRIGIVAPSSPFSRPRFTAGLTRLRSLGFQTAYPRQIFDQDGFLAGSDEDRARVLMEVWTDPGNQAVMAARGGHGALRLLDLLDFSRLAANPKVLIGFSDITVLHLALIREAGLTVIHGPVVTSLAEADQETLLHLKKLLTGKPVFPLALNPEGLWKEGRARGPLWGGNLTLLVHLMAAGRLPDPDGAILFLEDIGEAPYRLDRMLAVLRTSGLLDRVRGLVLGDFTDCGPQDEVERVLKQNLLDFVGPVAAEFPAGHGPSNLALPFGPRAILDTRQGVLDMDEPWFTPR